MAYPTPKSFTLSFGEVISGKWDTEKAFLLYSVFIQGGETLSERTEKSKCTMVAGYVDRITPKAYDQGFRQFKFTHTIEQRVITFCFGNYKFDDDHRMIPFKDNDTVDVEIQSIENCS